MKPDSIYTTHDAGNTWTKLQSQHDICCWVESSSTTIAAGSSGAGATIIQTSDGGETWYQSDSRRLKNRFASPRLHLLIIAEVGRSAVPAASISTVNGGRTWARQDSTVDVDLFDREVYRRARRLGRRR